MTMHDTPSGLNWDLGLAPPADGLWCGLAPGGEPTPRHPLPADAPACLVVQGGMLRWVGPQAQLPAAFSAWRRFDARDAARTGAHGAAPGAPGTLATPALVDCHTHLVYGGQRADEFALRLAGASYEALAQAGGGIL